MIAQTAYQTLVGQAASGGMGLNNDWTNGMGPNNDWANDVGLKSGSLHSAEKRK